jgi:two-component system response regulator VicR
MPNILVIDDDEIMLQVITAILEKEGFTVFTAITGKDVFDMLKLNPFEVVITDLMLPYVNGLEVINGLRQGEAYRQVGIIVFSAVDNEEVVTEAFRLGADDYIKKPLFTADLVTSVRKLIENKNSNQFVTRKKQGLPEPLIED